MSKILVLILCIWAGTSFGQIDLRQLIPDSMQYMVPVTDSLLEGEYYQKYYKLADPHIFFKEDSICVTVFEGLDTSCVFIDTVLVSLDTYDTYIDSVRFENDTVYLYRSDTSGVLIDSFKVYIPGAIDTDIDSVTLIGNVLHIYEDEVDRFVDLSGILVDSCLQSLIVSNGIPDTIFITYCDGVTPKDTVLVWPAAFNDSYVDSAGVWRNDSIPFYRVDTSGIIDSFWIVVPSDSIPGQDTYIDSIRYDNSNDTLYVYRYFEGNIIDSLKAEIPDSTAPPDQDWLEIPGAAIPYDNSIPIYHGVSPSQAKVRIGQDSLENLSNLLINGGAFPFETKGSIPSLWRNRDIAEEISWDLVRQGTEYYIRWANLDGSNEAGTFITMQYPYTGDSSLMTIMNDRINFSQRTNTFNDLANPKSYASTYTTRDSIKAMYFPDIEGNVLIAPIDSIKAAVNDRDWLIIPTTDIPYDINDNIYHGTGPSFRVRMGQDSLENGFNLGLNTGAGAFETKAQVPSIWRNRQYITQEYWDLRHQAGEFVIGNGNLGTSRYGNYIWLYNGYDDAFTPMFSLNPAPSTATLNTDTIEFSQFPSTRNDHPKDSLKALYYPDIDGLVNVMPIDSAKVVFADYDFIKLDGDTAVTNVDTLLPLDIADLDELLWRRGKIRLYDTIIPWQYDTLTNKILKLDPAQIQIPGRYNVLDFYEQDSVTSWARIEKADMWDRVTNHGNRIDSIAAWREWGATSKYKLPEETSFDITSRTFFRVSNQANEGAFVLHQDSIQLADYSSSREDTLVQVSDITKLFVPKANGTLALVSLDTINAALSVAAGSPDLLYWDFKGDSLGILWSGLADTGFVDLSKYGLTISGDSIYQGDSVYALPQGADSLGRNGTAGQLVFETNTKAPNSSSSLFWDNSNKWLGIGTSSPNQLIDARSTTTSAQISLTNSGSGYGSTDGTLIGSGPTDGYLWNYENGSLYLGTNNSLSLRLLPTGQILLDKYNSPAAFAGSDVGILGFATSGLVTTLDAGDLNTFLGSLNDGSETKVTAGASIGVTGAGTTISPYVITNTAPNIQQDFSNSSNSTSHRVTLTNSGGDYFEVIEGAGISLTTSGSTANGSVTIANTGDLSINNELQSLTFSALASNAKSLLPTISGTGVSFKGGTGISITDGTSSAGQMIISNTQTEYAGWDLAVNNEGSPASTGVGAHIGNEEVVDFRAGTGMSVARSTVSGRNVITYTATGSGGDDIGTNGTATGNIVYFNSVGSPVAAQENAFWYDQSVNRLNVDLVSIDGASGSQGLTSTGNLTLNSAGTTNISDNTYIGAATADQLYVSASTSLVKLEHEDADASLSFFQTGSTTLHAGNALVLDGDAGMTLDAGTGSIILRDATRIGSTSSPSRTLSVTGDIGYTTGIFNDSDRRLKKDIIDIEDAYGKILLLRPRYYERKSVPGKTELGFIAQEYQKVFPDQVEADENGMLSIAYQSASIITTAAVQQLIREKEQMQRTIDDLRAVVVSHEDRLLKLEKMMKK